MNGQRLLLAGVAALGLLSAGAVVASAVNDVPQDAQPSQAAPARQEPPSSPTTADLNRQQFEQNQKALNPQPTGEGVPTIIIGEEAAPEVDRPAAPARTSAIKMAEIERLEKLISENPATPERRRRMRTAIVEAVDKVTAETMRFEVPVGGRPIRFNQTLLFTAKACEVSAPDERIEDSVAYLEVALQPRGLRAAETRRIFGGWMYASTPSLNGIQHPVYDAWIVGCKA